MLGKFFNMFYKVFQGLPVCAYYNGFLYSGESAGIDNGLYAIRLNGFWVERHQPGEGEKTDEHGITECAHDAILSQK